MFLLGGGLLLVVVLARPGDRVSGPDRFEQLSQDALALLESGELEDAYNVAMGLLNRPDVRGVSRSRAYFVLGSYHCLKAPETTPAKQSAHYFRTVQYLKRARALGAGESYDGLLDLRSGLGWLRLGRADRAIPFLKAGAKGRSHRAGDAYTWLAQAYQESDPPRFEAALSAIAVVLSRIGPDDARRGTLLLRRAELLCEVGRYQDVQATVDGIAAGSEEAAVGHYWLARAMMGQGRLKDAAKRLSRLSQMGSLGPQWRCRAAYYEAKCHSLMESYRTALDAFRAVAVSYPGTEEALGADLERAEMLWRLKETNGAIDQYACALGQMDDPLRYSNRYVSLAALRGRLERCWRELFEAQQYDRAMRVADLYKKVALEGDGTLLKARSAGQWARELMRQSNKLPHDAAQAIRARARDLYLQAGREFRQLAQTRQSDRAYPDYLWHSAHNLLAAGAFEQVTEVLEQFEQADDRDPRYPQALVDWGTCLQEIGRAGEAVACYDKCLFMFPKNQAAFQARLQRAKCLIRMGRADDAEKALLASLESKELSPNALEWRESLFALGNLYYDTGRYEQAVNRLREAVGRYPDAKQTGLARYLVAESLRRWAEESEKALPKAKSNRARVLLMEQRDQRLTEALAVYRALVREMSGAEDAGRLDALGEASLRNSYFAVGDCRYKLGRHQEAIAAYQVAAGRYQDEPDSLGAYMQIHNCYRRLGQSDQARRVVEQARWVLRRIPESAFAERPNVMSRQQWRQWLDTARQM